VYLIMGGLTGTGAAVAAYLAKTVQARLVLVEDGAWPARDEWDTWAEAAAEPVFARARIETLRALESAGAEVEVVGVDAASEPELRRAVELAYQRFGALHGVFHTAEPRDADPAQTTIGSDGQHHFQGKVYGTYNLERALAGREPDFCLLMSSVTALLGGAGRMPHAAANLFLNAFARARSRDAARPHWLSVNWDEAANDEETAEALRHLFALGEVSQVVVSTEDLTTRLRAAGSGAAAADAPAAIKSGAASLHARPQTGVPYVAPASPTERIIAGIWQSLLGIDGVGVHDNFFQLGGNSLVGIQLTSQLREAFHADIPVHAIFAAATVSDLALVIEDILLTEIEALGEVDAA
jgi:hypothetical protein